MTAPTVDLSALLDAAQSQPTLDAALTAYGEEPLLAAYDYGYVKVRHGDGDEAVIVSIRGALRWRGNDRDLLRLYLTLAGEKHLGGSR
jgi:hypothetical protein